MRSKFDPPPGRHRTFGPQEQVNLASDEFLETVKINVDLQQLNRVDLQQLKMEIALEKSRSIE